MVKKTILYILQCSVNNKELVMQWMSHAMSIERQTKAFFEKSAEFAELMAKEGMQTMVLKGLALSGYYPNPWYREYLFKVLLIAHPLTSNRSVRLEN